MKHINNFQSLLKTLLPLPETRPLIIAIDGRPCSGKTTLALQLEKALNCQTIYLDEFFISKRIWPANVGPNFPFFYFRYNEFMHGIKTLAAGLPFQYYSYNYETDDISAKPTIITPEKPIIVEGVSTLHPDLVDVYFKKIWVTSNLETELAAIIAREGLQNIETWKNIYIPSVDIYCRSNPWHRADIIYAGRNAQHNFSTESSIIS